MTVIHPPVKPDTGPVGLHEHLSGKIVTQSAWSETNAINALVDMQRANGDAIDPNGARRLVRSLVALGLLRFE